MRRGLPVGVVGLGVMGSAMSAHLLAAGFPVLGFDVDAGRTAEHAERGGGVCGSPAEVAAGAEIVVTSLPGAGALSDVLDGLRGGARPGLVIVATSTLSPQVERDPHDRASEWGATLLDYPLSELASESVSQRLREAPAERSEAERERNRAAGARRRPRRLPQRRSRRAPHGRAAAGRVT